MAGKPAYEKRKKKNRLKEVKIKKTEGTGKIKWKQRLQVRKASLSPSKHLNLTVHHKQPLSSL